MIPETEWKFLEATEHRIAHLRRHREENALALLRGEAPPADPRELAAREAELAQEFDYPARVEQARGMEPTPEQARRLDLHRQWATATVLATHPEIAPLAAGLTLRFAAFRPRLRDREIRWSTLRAVLAGEDDRELRREAFEAPSALATETGEPLRALFALREALARQVAGAGYPALFLFAADLERGPTVSLLDEAERTLRRTFTEARKEAAAVLGVRRAEPWDYLRAATKLREPAERAFPPDTALDAAHLQARRWGFEPTGLPIRVETVPAARAARAVAVEIPGDVRVVLPPEAGFAAYRSVFRAYGTALYLAHLAPRRPLLARETPAAAEAAGALFASVLEEPEWLEEHGGLDAGAIEAHRRACRLERLFRLRLLEVRRTFEELVYADSTLEPHRLYADALERTFACTRSPAPLWASHASLVAAPLAPAAALLGEVSAAQLRRAMEESVPGSWKRPEAGRWLREEVFAPGAVAPWPERVERITGSPLGVDALAAALGAEPFRGPYLDEREDEEDPAVAELRELMEGEGTGDPETGGH